MKVRRFDGIPVGNYDPEARRYIQKRRFKAHSLKKPPAWSMDLAIKDRLDEADCEEWVILQMDAPVPVWWIISWEVVLREGFVIERGGFPPQWAVPLRFWSKRDSRQPSLF